MHITGKFSGMTALVTGGSSGIGAATAALLAAQGAELLIHYATDRAGAERTRTAVAAAGASAEIVPAELSTRDGVEQFLLALGDRRIDLLINNAGSLLARTPLLDMGLEQWDRTMMLNVTSVLMISQQVAKGMLARGHGVIVNVGSIAGRNGGGPGAGAYATAKGAVATLTKAMAREWAPRGIRVNCVSPGTIATPFHERFSTDAMMEAVKNATPAGRLGTSEETAEVIVFLCSDQARYIHGQTIEVNGGIYAP